MVSSTFFSYGCTFEQRKELLDEVKAYAIENGKDILKNAVSSAVETATAYVDTKLAEKEAFHLKLVDSQLATLPVIETDPDTGVETTRVRTWKDFDADKSGHLEEAELAKVGAFTSMQLARKVASGEITKDEFSRQAKGTATTLGALGLILLAMRAAAKAKQKLSGSPNPSPPAPTGGTT